MQREACMEAEPLAISRRQINVATLVLMVLCTAAAWLLVLSFGSPNDAGVTRRLRLHNGDLWIGSVWGEPGKSANRIGRIDAGLVTWQRIKSGSQEWWAVRLDLVGWCIALALLPLARVGLFGVRRYWLWSRHRRVLVSACLECGHDLRYSPHRCPRCGTIITRAEVLPLPQPPPRTPEEKAVIRERLLARTR
jgi:hypothetical protein